MADSERLYTQLDKASNEIGDICERSRDLTDQIAALIRAFAKDHGCTDKGVDRAIEYTADALVDLIEDATGPAYRRKVRIENEIGNIEWADLRRSAPVVL